jgi:hypothetical protein
MRRHAAVVIAIALAGACQRGESDAAKQAAAAPTPRPAPAPAPAPSEPTEPTEPVPVQNLADAYARDIDRICRVMELSAAGADPGVNPTLVTAQWLQANLESEQAREFLITRLNRSSDAERGPLLDAESTRVGLSSCPTARLYDPK